jgi:hypothetical protein
MEMTRDEAIAVLNMVEAHGSLVIEAKDMAIKALEQEGYYKDLAQSYEKTIVKLTEAVAEPIQRWIPVSERLPESSGVYIVSRWFSDGEERAILVDANYYDGNGYWYNDNRINWGRDLVTNRIVAWMPLPEPYKAEMESE